MEKELNDYLKSLGASLVGFADLSNIEGSLRNNMNYGISFAIKINFKVIEDINKGATRAGLGWIGKNALLITPEYGSAIRLSSVITDMPLSANNPINKSKCGACNKCKTTCPAGAINGVLWSVDSKREELIDPYKCRQTARKLLKERIGIEMVICGKCIEICPFTQGYIKRSRVE